MASTAPEAQPEKPGKAGQPEQDQAAKGLSPVARKRLEKMFEHAEQRASQEQYDYAVELLTQCVLGDPGNMAYAQKFVDTLRRKYKQNKKGAPFAHFKARGARSAVKKAIGGEQWADAVKHGVAALKLNPWDVPMLMAMAQVAEHLGSRECQLGYLKAALEVNPKDVAVNKACAIVLQAVGQFDQAIACLRRAEQESPDDEEIQRRISELLVRKTVKVDQQAQEDPSRTIAAHKAGTAADEEDLTPEERLKRRLQQDPNNLPASYELAQLYANQGRYEEAEEVFARAYEASGESEDVKERWEDLQVRRLRAEVTAARKRRKESPEAEAEYRRLRKRLNDKEKEVWHHLCDRYPNNMRFRYDLGLRYQIAGDFQEAIKLFQVARTDPRCRGLCNLALGECFQQIKQYRLAINHYESAIQGIPDRDADNKKKALYNASRLAMALKNYATAEKYLTQLAGLDFGYRDVSSLLDKLAAASDGGEEGK